MATSIFNPSIPSLVGTTIFAQSISDTSRKILNLVENIFQYNCSIQDTLNETDIQATLKTLDVFVEEINENNNKTLHIALENLNNVIEELHTTINQINSECEYHATKYFSNYRKLDLSKYCEIIKKKSNILDKRFHLLIQVMQINHNNIQDKIETNS